MKQKRFTIEATSFEHLRKYLDPLKDKYGMDMVCLISEDGKSADVIITERKNVTSMQ